MTVWLWLYIKSIFCVLAQMLDIIPLSSHDMKAFHNNGVQNNKDMALYRAFVQCHLCTFITDFLVSYQKQHCTFLWSSHFV